MSAGRHPGAPPPQPPTTLTAVLAGARAAAGARKALEPKGAPGQLEADVSARPSLATVARTSPTISQPAPSKAPHSTSAFSRFEHETGFTNILHNLLGESPGAHAMAVVDEEGECVDYAGEEVDPYQIKVAAAQWRITLMAIESSAFRRWCGAVRKLAIETPRRTFVVDTLPDGYALLSMHQRHYGLGYASRGLDRWHRELYREAGWPTTPGQFPWHEVKVLLAEGRPEAIVDDKDRIVPMAVIGRVASGLQPGEVGYRVTTASPVCEMTLIQSRHRWFADLPPSTWTG